MKSQSALSSNVPCRITQTTEARIAKEQAEARKQLIRSNPDAARQMGVSEKEIQAAS